MTDYGTEKVEIDFALLAQMVEALREHTMYEDDYAGRAMEAFCAKFPFFEERMLEARRAGFDWSPVD